MKYRDPLTGEFKEISVKAGDTLPIGTIVDYDGDTVPDGYEEVDDEKIIWNNLDETSTFVNQTIPLDLSKYNKIEILYKPRKDLSQILTTGKIPIGKITILNYSAFYNFERYVTLSTTGIIFNSCVYYKTFGDTTPDTQDDYCIPIQIIGYK